VQASVTPKVHQKQQWCCWNNEDHRHHHHQLVVGWSASGTSAQRWAPRWRVTNRWPDCALVLGSLSCLVSFAAFVPPTLRLFFVTFSARLQQIAQNITKEKATTGHGLAAPEQTDAWRTDRRQRPRSDPGPGNCFRDGDTVIHFFLREARGRKALHRW
jgi:hypothetical protein